LKFLFHVAIIQLEDNFASVNYEHIFICQYDTKNKWASFISLVNTISETRRGNENQKINEGRSTQLLP